MCGILWGNGSLGDMYPPYYPTDEAFFLAVSLQEVWSWHTPDNRPYYYCELYCTCLPEGYTINDGTTKESCSFQCMFITEATEQILAGMVGLLWIESCCFGWGQLYCYSRLLPMHSSLHHAQQWSALGYDDLFTCGVPECVQKCKPHAERQGFR